MLIGKYFQGVRIAVLDALYMVLPQLKKSYFLDDYPIHLDLSIGDAFIKKGHFPSIMSVGITGDIQVNDKDIHHPPKTIYRHQKSPLILDKLAQLEIRGLQLSTWSLFLNKILHFG